MKVTIEHLWGNEYWINFQEPENDKTPYVRIFNKNFTLEKKSVLYKKSIIEKDGSSVVYILIGESGIGQDFMWNEYGSSVKQAFDEDDMIYILERIIRKFFKEYYNIEF